MMRYIKYILILNAICFFGLAQKSGEIETLNATFLPKVKRYTVTMPGGEIYNLRKDTAYTMIVLAKLRTLEAGDKLVVNVGEQPDEAFLINAKFNIVNEEGNIKAVYSDDLKPSKITSVINGYVQLYFDITLSDYNKLKWLTVFVKRENVELQKKYYGVEKN